MKKKLYLVCVMTVLLLQNIVSQITRVAETPYASLISDLTKVGDKLYFTSFHPEDSIMLWVTDGTINSSHVIKKFQFDYTDGISRPHCFTDFNGNLIFTADENHDADKSKDYERNPYLWKSDGTSAGTVKIKKLWKWYYWEVHCEAGVEYIQLGDKLLFHATAAGTHNFELWESDGTTEGTGMLAELNKNQDDSYPNELSSHPINFTKLDDKVFFTASDTVNNGVWVTDGTETGTHLIEYINPDNPNTFPLFSGYVLKANNNRVFFCRFGGTQLWTSDGIESGTSLLKTFLFDDKYLKRVNSIIGVVNGNVFFDLILTNRATNNIDSIQLWKSDGTEEGTVKVSDLKNNCPIQAITSNSNIYFLTTNWSNYQLWRSDGSEEGTYKISSLSITDTYSNKLFVFKDVLYFVAFDKNNILSIWESDGTIEGTRTLENWNAPGFTSISDLVYHHDEIYFTAIHPDYGAALFKYSLNTIINTHLNPSANKLIISPNPSESFVNIYLPNPPKEGTLSIFDLMGNKVISMKVKPYQEITNFDIKALKQGIYIVVLSANSDFSTGKIIKK
jgi:trimeric autotransporter adhesin